MQKSKSDSFIKKSNCTYVTRPYNWNMNQKDKVGVRKKSKLKSTFDKPRLVDILHKVHEYCWRAFWSYCRWMHTGPTDFFCIYDLLTVVGKLVVECISCTFFKILPECVCVTFWRATTKQQPESSRKYPFQYTFWVEWAKIIC